MKLESLWNVRRNLKTPTEMNVRRLSIALSIKSRSEFFDQIFAERQIDSRLELVYSDTHDRRISLIIDQQTCDITRLVLNIFLASAF